MRREGRQTAPPVALTDDNPRLAPDAAAPYLVQLAALVTVARPGALFPPGKPVVDFLGFLARARPRLGPPTVEVSRVTGLPVRRQLARLLAHQQAVRELLARHRARATRASSSYHVALAATELPPLARTTARLVARDGRTSRVLVVHDAVTRAGRVVRLTVQLSQQGTRLVTFDARDQATPTVALEAAVLLCAQAPQLDEAWPAFETTAGVTVHEVERGELGPFLSTQVPSAGALDALRDVLRRAPGGGAVLSLALERVGESVKQARCVDPWAQLPPLDALLRRRGVGAFRERRLLCTPSVETAVKALAPGCIVRSR
jgi:hypothetical protein